MKLLTLLLCTALLVPAALNAQTDKVAHRFLKSGCNSESVAIVARDGTIEWEYPIKSETNDAWLLPNGNIIFAFKAGVREVKPDKTTVWEYLAQAGSEIHGCQPLGADLVLVGEACNDGTTNIYEMDRACKILKKLTLSLGGGSHTQIRQIRKTPQATYLVTQQRKGGVAMEFDATGKLLRQFPDGRYAAERLPDGNTLIACGDGHRVIEVNAQNNIVWEVKQDDIPGNKIGFAAAVVRLANGNTVICNWPGHGGMPKDQPQVFEITRAKKLVWEVRDPRLNMISAIQILDAPTLTPALPAR